ncbi:dnaJ homolog subfamily C member 8 [Dermatophagoides farinae]|uniref:DnaJ (Hsp40), sub C, member 8 n=1 Tax=Dermatophagoides farinae TaxID=6954 RepID=A0A922HL09_DERFA|nr:dnaJ homolog subfamily C member 8-like [Dermatophagoides farinae]KAH7643936.1 dnaj-like protein subfamily c member 8-like protein [Dermatophagoides farinae]KAH9497016.1 DnaJ (Hsp40), sub C, member 8 [Dermatophagoides farinae]
MASSSSSSSGNEFNSFYSEVKTIEKQDSIYTSEQQIQRLLRPGSTYANLNPFEVLLVDPDASIERIKKQYKKLSILLHPDKNPNDQERAQRAFDALTKAYKVLEDEKSRTKALEIVEEAKYKLNKEIQEKRKRLKQLNPSRKDPRVDEDDPEKYKQSLRVVIMKLFAEQERKRRMMQDKVQEEKKRQREEEIEQQQQKEAEKEWQKNFEESRQNRVDSWHTFNKKAKFKRKDIRPPKHKAEGR